MTFDLKKTLKNTSAPPVHLDAAAHLTLNNACLKCSSHHWDRCSLDHSAKQLLVSCTNMHTIVGQQRHTAQLFDRTNSRTHNQQSQQWDTHTHAPSWNATNCMKCWLVVVSQSMLPPTELLCKAQNRWSQIIEYLSGCCLGLQFTGHQT